LPSYNFGHILCLFRDEKQRIFALRIINLISILLLTSILTACTTVTSSTEPPVVINQQNREAQLLRLDQFQVNGKLAARTAQDAGSAVVDWQQRGNQYAIALSGPLGAHAMQLTGAPGNVTLKTSDGQRFHANSPEQLLAERFGFRLPVSNINYWIRGLPVPGVPADTTFDSAHRLTKLVQQGWDIAYLNYTKVNGIDLPQKMAIDSAALQVKIVIYQWKLG
jgi:outer membrane lipoprotein LolB